MPDLYGVWAMRRPRGLKEKRRNLEKAVLITESIRKKGVGEAKAEEINRKFRDGRIYIPDNKFTRGLKPEHQRYVKNIEEI